MPLNKGGILVEFVGSWGEFRMKAERMVQNDIHIIQLVRERAQVHLVVMADYLTFVLFP